LRKCRQALFQSNLDASKEVIRCACAERRRRSLQEAGCVRQINRQGVKGDVEEGGVGCERCCGRRWSQRDERKRLFRRPRVKVPWRMKREDNNVKTGSSGRSEGNVLGSDH
jgi:ABC-type phosphonate transport system ATPase subunit